MKRIRLLFAFLVILPILSSNARCQDTVQYIDPMHLPISIRAVRITLYEHSPLRIDGRFKWSKGIWAWIMEKSIFTDSTMVSKKKIEGNALIKSICRGDGIVDIVVSVDSVLYEVITIAKNDKVSGSEAIEVGKEYPISLFPFYNHPYTMAYSRNEPIYLDGYVIWINRRKLHSNIYLSPNIQDVFYNPAIDAEKNILELIRYRD